MQPLHLRCFYHHCLVVFKAVNGDVDFNFGLRRNIEFHQSIAVKQRCVFKPRFFQMYYSIEF